jgi:hypothetical protein
MTATKTRLRVLYKYDLGRLKKLKFWLGVGVCGQWHTYYQAYFPCFLFLSFLFVISSVRYNRRLACRMLPYDSKHQKGILAKFDL